MSYIPLHHKYRPQSLAQLVGQTPIAITLTNAINRQQITPAYLLCGPRGTGKTSTARILAKSLNCASSEIPTCDPCGQCHSCRAIALGNSLDVLELDAASHSGVEQIREIIEKAQFTSLNRHKVFILDEAHALSSSAMQALLKTLEEPPSRVIFILCTTEPQKLGDTIISRCQRFNFRPISSEALTQHLRVIAASEQIEITDEAIALLARHSNGGLRDAQTLLDQLRLLGETVTTNTINDLVGAVSEQALWELLDAIATTSPDAVLKKLRAISQTGKEPLSVLGNLLDFYTQAIVAKSSPEQLTTVSLEVSQSLKTLSLDQNTLLNQLSHLRSCESQVKFSRQPRMMLEVAVLELLTRSTTSSTVATSQVQSTANLEILWQQVIDYQAPALKALLSQQAQLVTFDGQTAQIQVKSSTLKPRVVNLVNLIALAFEKAIQKQVTVLVI